MADMMIHPSFPNPQNSSDGSDYRWDPEVTGEKDYRDQANWSLGEDGGVARKYDENTASGAKYKKQQSSANSHLLRNSHEDEE